MADNPNNSLKYNTFVSQKQLLRFPTATDCIYICYMYNRHIMATTTKTMLNIKIDSKLKRKAQKMAKSFGLPLSVVVSRKLEEFTRDNRLVFEKPLVPNAKTAKLIDESVRDYKTGKMKNFSGPFHGVDEAIAHLKKL